MGRTGAAGLAVMLALLAGRVQAQVREPERGALAGPGWADPSDVIAAEIAFARMAQDKGQWAAFRANAAKGAQMFAGTGAGTPVRVAEFLKGRAEPATALKWQPFAVWMACDGSYAVTRGAWQSGEASGWFATVWQRQDRRGGYKWVLDQGGDLAKPLAAPDFLTAKVADCPARGHHDADDAARHGKHRGGRGAPAPEYLAGRSDDGTLAWATVLGPGNARRFSVTVKHDGAMREVFAADASPTG